jgi:hypothetical protein
MPTPWIGDHRLPGAVSRQKLVCISAGLGLGQSARFLLKQHDMFWRFFLPHGYRPDRLVKRLAPALGRPEHNLQGFHLFTFNEVARTEAWRQEWLARLSGRGREVASYPAGGEPAGCRPAKHPNEDPRCDCRATGSRLACRHLPG